jgi:hypothetical protein
MADQIFDSNDRIPDEGEDTGGAILWLFVALFVMGCGGLVGGVLFLVAHGAVLP